jgi:hypothetical protein
MKQKFLTHQFVEFIPERLETGVIYISMVYATATHTCCCGCGNKVVTQFSPTDWRLTYNGETISLHPSIGNWSFECKSHYIIRNSHVDWSDKWTQQKIDAGRARDQLAKNTYHANKNTAFATPDIPPVKKGISCHDSKSKLPLWTKLKTWML